MLVLKEDKILRIVSWYKIDKGKIYESQPMFYDEDYMNTPLKWRQLPDDRYSHKTYEFNYTLDQY